MKKPSSQTYRSSVNGRYLAERGARSTFSTESLKPVSKRASISQAQADAAVRRVLSEAAGSKK
jgi:hypothetical protein